LADIVAAGLAVGSATDHLICAGWPNNELSDIINQ